MIIEAPYYKPLIPVPVAYTLGNGEAITDPTKSIDEDLTTSTTEKKYTGDGTVNNSTGLIYVFTQKIAKLSIKAGFRASGANSGFFYIEKSLDGITYTDIDITDRNPGVVEVIISKTFSFNSRYLRVRVGGATTAGVQTFIKVYEVY